MLTERIGKYFYEQQWTPKWTLRCAIIADSFVVLLHLWCYCCWCFCAVLTFFCGQFLCIFTWWSEVPSRCSKLPSSISFAAGAVAIGTPYWVLWLRVAVLQNTNITVSGESSSEFPLLKHMPVCMRCRCLLWLVLLSELGLNSLRVINEQLR